MFMGEIRHYVPLRSLAKQVLNLLINHMLIGEPKKVDGVKTQEVRIVYHMRHTSMLPGHILMEMGMLSQNMESAQWDFIAI